MTRFRALLCLLLLSTSLQVAAAAPDVDAACADACATPHAAAATQDCDGQTHCGDHESRCAGHCMPALSASPHASPLLTAAHVPADPLEPAVDSPPARLLRPPIPA